MRVRIFENFLYFFGVKEGLSKDYGLFVMSWAAYFTFKDGKGFQKRMWSRIKFGKSAHS